MTVSEIDAFLAVVRYGSMAEAARRLYTSQPTLSRRLHSLEEELGYALLLRNKGVRTVELTRQGEKFIQIAENWKHLWDDMQKINSYPEDYLLHFSAVAPGKCAGAIVLLGKSAIWVNLHHKQPFWFAGQGHPVNLGGLDLNQAPVGSFGIVGFCTSRE